MSSYNSGDDLDSEEPPASYIVKLTTGNKTDLGDFEVWIDSKLLLHDQNDEI